MSIVGYDSTKIALNRGKGNEAEPNSGKKGMSSKQSPPLSQRIAGEDLGAELGLNDICLTPASSGQGMASVSQLGSEQASPSAGEQPTLFQIVTPVAGNGGEGGGTRAEGDRGHPHDFSESTGYDRSNSSVSKDGSMLFRVLPPAGTTGTGTSSGGTQTPGRGQSISTSTFQVQFASSLSGLPRETVGSGGGGGGGTGGVDLSTAGPLPLPRHSSPVGLASYHGPLSQSTTSANSIFNSSADSRRALREEVECYHLPE
jgi:hypothetical protein